MIHDIVNVFLLIAFALGSGFVSLVLLAVLVRRFCRFILSKDDRIEHKGEK